MGIESLTTLDILHGTFATIFSILCIVIGIRILLKYFKYKQNTFITFGITWIFVGSSWWGGMLSFFSVLLFDYEFELFQLLFLGEIFFPLTVIFWMYSFCSLLFPKVRTKVVIIYIVIIIIHYIILLDFLFTDPTLIASKNGAFLVIYNTYGSIFQLFMYMTAFITGIILSIKSMKSEDPVVQWKGKFILIGVFSFLIGTSLYVLDPTFTLFVLLCYIILASSAIEFSFGFLLPYRLAEWLIKRGK